MVRGRTACLALLGLLFGMAILPSWSATRVGPEGGGFKFSVAGKVSADGKGVTAADGKLVATGQRKLELKKRGPSSGVMLNGTDDWLVVAKDHNTILGDLPKRAFSVSAWVLPDAAQDWGAFFSCMQDDGNTEYGIILGFIKDKFSFALSTKGADDGDGKLTYLKAPAAFAPGRWYLVTGTYDGATMRLYVNGKQVAESAEQSGDVNYPPSPATVALGCYLDATETYPMTGLLGEISMTHEAMTAEQVATAFKPHADAVNWDPLPPPKTPFVVAPFLNYATMNSITIAWETAEDAGSYVEYGTSLPMTEAKESAESKMLHHVELTGLKPSQQYFYRVTSRRGEEVISRSEVYTFRTAAGPGEAIAFTIIGDTQNNPGVTAKIAEHVYALRPDFQIHVGDIVGKGSDKREWTEEFFKPSHTLMSRICVYPAIGNHEEDTHWFYDYFALPNPENYYAFKYGDAEVFMVDTNKPILPGTPQYQWLEKALGESKALWKFVCHHHPIYSSDNDDHGDTYRGPSTWGGMQHRPLAALYEKHNVDIVFNGHIHLYERTHPIRGGKVDPTGVRYITTGGSGGGLEAFAPSRTWFTAQGRITHHYSYVTVIGRQLSFKVFDLDNRLFDSFEMSK